MKKNESKLHQQKEKKNLNYISKLCLVLSYGNTKDQWIRASFENKLWKTILDIPRGILSVQLRGETGIMLPEMTNHQNTLSVFWNKPKSLLEY